MRGHTVIFEELHIFSIINSLFTANSGRLDFWIEKQCPWFGTQTDTGLMGKYFWKCHCSQLRAHISGSFGRNVNDKTICGGDCPPETRAKHPLIGGTGGSSGIAQNDHCSKNIDVLGYSASVAS